MDGNWGESSDEDAQDDIEALEARFLTRWKVLARQRADWILDEVLKRTGRKQRLIGFRWYCLF